MDVMEDGVIEEIGARAKMKFTPSQQGFQQQEMIRSILSVEK
jgi:hypothetical protein